MIQLETDGNKDGDFDIDDIDDSEEERELLEDELH